MYVTTRACVCVSICLSLCGAGGGDRREEGVEGSSYGSVATPQKLIPLLPPHLHYVCIGFSIRRMRLLCVCVRLCIQAALPWPPLGPTPDDLPLPALNDLRWSPASVHTTSPQYFEIAFKFVIKFFARLRRATVSAAAST